MRLEPNFAGVVRFLGQALVSIGERLGRHADRRVSVATQEPPDSQESSPVQIRDSHVKPPAGVSNEVWEHYLAAGAPVEWLERVALHAPGFLDLHVENEPRSTERSKGLEAGDTGERRRSPGAFDAALMQTPIAGPSSRDPRAAKQSDRSPRAPGRPEDDRQLGPAGGGGQPRRARSPNAGARNLHSSLSAAHSSDASPAGAAIQFPNGAALDTRATEAGVEAQTGAPRAEILSPASEHPNLPGEARSRAHDRPQLQINNRTVGVYPMAPKAERPGRTQEPEQRSVISIAPADLRPLRGRAGAWTQTADSRVRDKPSATDAPVSEQLRGPPVGTEGGRARGGALAHSLEIAPVSRIGGDSWPSLGVDAPIEAQLEWWEAQQASLRVQFLDAEQRGLVWNGPHS